MTNHENYDAGSNVDRRRPSSLPPMAALETVQNHETREPFV